MRKKLFCGLISFCALLSTMVAYASEPARVDEDYQKSTVSEVNAGEELPKMDAPANARWEKQTGSLFFDASPNGSGR